MERTFGFTTVLGMPTSVLRYGKIQSDTKAVFLVIPGNPGVIEFYDQFMSRLYTQGEGQMPVWGVSHAGHVQPPGGNQELYNKLNYDVCTLEGQIRHKLTFIEENIPKHVKVFLIGHSIGCKMILDIIDQSNRRIERCFQLFPTIERMAISPNGKIYTPALKYFRWLVPFILLIFSILPENLKLWLIKIHFGNRPTPACIRSGTLTLLNPFVVSNAMFMANQEMQEVDKLEEDLVRKNIDRMSFYFGQTDGWCPQRYYRDLKDIFPKGDLRLCEKGYSHAFVIDAGEHMADIVWDWAQPYL